MESLESWLKQATRHLSVDSTSKVRAEVGEHYELAVEDERRKGAKPEDADRSAIFGLGDPRMANRGYRQVLLTAAEQRALREGNWEARVVCSRPTLRALLLALPLAVVCGAVYSIWTGSFAFGGALLAGGTGMGLALAAPYLPVFTPRRARVFRAVKWTLLAGMFGALFFALNSSWWLFVTLLSTLIAIEGARMSIRRKLPVSQWPKQLYL